MKFESYIMAELLHRLEQRGVGLQSRALGIATALSRDQFADALDATKQLVVMLETVVLTHATLRGHIRGDGMGELGDSLEEVGLRARGLVIDTQLARLEVAFRDGLVRARTLPWFVGAVESIDDLTALVRARLQGIHALWSAYRKDHPQPRAMSTTDREAMCRIMARVAQRALQDLGSEPELAHFLRHALAASGLPEIQMASRQLADALSVPVDDAACRRLESSLRHAHAATNANAADVTGARTDGPPTDHERRPG